MTISAIIDKTVFIKLIFRKNIEFLIFLIATKKQGLRLLMSQGHKNIFAC